MTESPVITIGLPVYNSERYLRQSLDSLLAQTYRNFVLVISDNASTDTTAEICRQYVAADSRVRYFRNDVNIGNPRNFNKLFELTSTPYLKWSTADDFWKPTFLERALEIMERDPSIALCYPGAVSVDADGGNPRDYDDVLHLVQEDPAERFLTLITGIGLAHQHLGLIRMSCLRQTCLLGTYVGSDINLLAELALYGKFYELPERLFFRRFHKDSGSWMRGDPGRDPQHDARLYYAAGAGRATLSKWRSHVSFFSAVSRSPLPLRSKLHVYRHLAHRMLWDRHDLAWELAQYAGLSSR